MDEVIQIRSKVQIILHSLQHNLKVKGILGREIIVEQHNRLLELFFFPVSRNDDAGQIRHHLFRRFQGLTLWHIPEYRRTKIRIANKVICLPQTLFYLLQLLIAPAYLFIQ